MSGYEVARIEAVITANNAKYDATLAKSEQRAKTFASNTEKSFARVHGAGGKLGGSMGSVNSQMQSMERRAMGLGRTLTNALGVGAGVGIVGLGGAVVRTGMKFDTTMSAVRATSQSTNAEFKKLRQAAIDLGGSTVFSATEVGGAMTELGKAGFNAQQQLSSIPGVLDAAAASGEEMSAVATVMVDTLGGFSMAASGATHVADGLAHAANATTTGIGELGEAMKYVAPVARDAGMSFDQTAAAFQIMANAGVKGSMAGTSLRGVLMSMEAPNKRVEKSMKEIGLSFRDAKGNMLPFDQSITRLSRSLSGMKKTDADRFLARMFGRENITAAKAFLDTGADGFKKFTREVAKSSGEARKMAKTMNDNLAGDVEQLKGALESAAIVLSDKFRPQFRDAVSDMQAWVSSDEFAEQAEAVASGVMEVAQAFANTVQFLYHHQDAVKAVVATYAAFRVAAAGAAASQVIFGASMSAGGAGGVVGGVGKLGSKLAVGTSMLSRFGSGFAVAGAAMAASPVLTGAAAIGLTGAALYGIYKIAQDTDDAMEFRKARRGIAEVSDAIARMPKRRVATVVIRTRREEEGNSGPSSVPSSGINGRRPGTFRHAEGQAVPTGLSDAVEIDEAMSKSADTLARSTERLNDALDDRAYAQKRVEADTTRRDMAQSNIDRIVEDLGAMDAAQDPLFKGYNLALDDANKSLGEHERKLADADDRVKKWGGTALTASGQLAHLKNQADLAAGRGKKLGLSFDGPLDRIGESAAVTRQKLSEMMGGPVSPKFARSALEKMSSVKLAAEFGTDDVNQIISRAFGVNASGKWKKDVDHQVGKGVARGKAAPREINPALSSVGNTLADGSWLGSFVGQISGAKSALAGLRGAAAAPINITTVHKNVTVSGTANVRKASGGKLTGPGTGTSDSILAAVSNGEFVIRAASVQKYGDGFLNAVNQGTLPRFASGGAVGGKAAEKMAAEWDHLRGAREGLATKADIALAKAERTPSPNDDVRALNRLMRISAGSERAYAKFLRQHHRAPGSMKTDIRSAIASEIRNQTSYRDQLRDVGARGKLDAILGRYALGDAKLDAKLAAAERTPGTADDAAVRREIIAANRREASELLRFGGTKAFRKLSSDDKQTYYGALAAARRDSLDGDVGGAGGSESTADTARLQRELEISQNRAMIAEGSLNAFASSGDIGTGAGRYAYGSAGGATTVNNIYALSGYDPAIQQALAASANTGNATGGNADRLYSGRVGVAA